MCLRDTGYVLLIICLESCAAGVIVHSRKAFAKIQDSSLASLRQRVVKDFPKVVDFITAANISESVRASEFYQQKNIFDANGKSDPTYKKGKYPWSKYDPVFANGYVTAFGQAVGLVIAEDLITARDAAAWLVENIAYTELHPLIKTVEQAKEIARDNPENEFQAVVLRQLQDTSDVPFKLYKDDGSDSNKQWLQSPQNDGSDEVYATGAQVTGKQNHFYMEPQVCLVEPSEGGNYKVYSSTHQMAEVHANVQHILGVSSTNVEVITNRLGGSFGGKTTRSNWLAMATAVAAAAVRRPVRVANDRNVDMMMMGSRHAFDGEYHIAGDKDGLICKLKFVHSLNGGFSQDCSFVVLQVALMNSDGAYDIPTFGLESTVYRTNATTGTAMRSFGAIQSALIREEAVEHFAYKVGKENPALTPHAVRLKNMYRDATEQSCPETPYRQKMPDCACRLNFTDLLRESDYEKRYSAVQCFNGEHKLKKRGISIIPITYGVAYTGLGAGSVFLNQGSACLTVFESDGKISIAHGGVEMGQGLSLRCASLCRIIPCCMCYLYHFQTICQC